MKYIKLASAVTALVLSASSYAAPINITANGVVTDAFGNLASALGNSYSIDITIDLNEANASDSEMFALDDPAYKRWYFDAPYSTTYNGNTMLGGIQVEVIDNYEATINGLTGTYDILGIYNGNVVCSVPSDPITGVCPEGNRIGGTDYGLDIFVASDWFNGIDSLPASIPQFSDLAGVFGWVESYDLTGVTGGLGVEYSSLNTTSVVPVPAAVWLFGSGLIGLVGFARRKKA